MYSDYCVGTAQSEGSADLVIVVSHVAVVAGSMEFVQEVDHAGLTTDTA